MGGETLRMGQPAPRTARRPVDGIWECLGGGVGPLTPGSLVRLLWEGARPGGGAARGCTCVQASRPPLCPSDLAVIT